MCVFPKRSNRNSASLPASCPDPLNVDRLRLNRLLHQTPDLPTQLKSAFSVALAEAGNHPFLIRGITAVVNSPTSNAVVGSR